MYVCMYVCIYVYVYICIKLYIGVGLQPAREAEEDELAGRPDACQQAAHLGRLIIIIIIIIIMNIIIIIKS